MHPYAQTNLQLYNQLGGAGYSVADLSLVRDAYELATVLFAGRFQPSGKSFIAHVVGTASVLASLRLPARVVAAGLLHNVFTNGDFGDGRPGISPAKRDQIAEALGTDIAEYAAQFVTLYWESPLIQRARHEPDGLSSFERHLLLVLFADHLEHLLDLDLLYYDDSGRSAYLRNGAIAAEIAEKLCFDRLASDLKNAIRESESAEPPVELIQPLKERSFILAPKSCCRRFFASLPQRRVSFAASLRQRSLNGLNLLYARSPDLLKTIYRAQKKRVTKWRAKGESLSGCLAAKSDAFKGLFPENAILERIATGFQFIEGPVWIEEERNLLFSDIPANRILRLKSNGRVVAFREPSGNSNGLTRDKEGRLIACEHSHRRVTRTEKDGSIKTLADKFQGKKLNSPNDVVTKSDGAIYFSDPSYGIKPDEQEQPIQGVYRLSPDGKELLLVAHDLARPNGLAFSPDEKKLYIDDSERRHIRVFDVEDDGALSGGSVFYDMNVSVPGAPDGMNVDMEGRVYCTGAGGVWVFDAQGKHLGTIVTPEKPSNCAWGDDDWQSLYITAVTSVYKIRVNTPGIKVP
jgi:gluconolactonase